MVDDAFNAQMSYRDFLIKEKRSEIFYLSEKVLLSAQELLEFILNILKNNSEYKIYNDRVKRPDNKIIFLNEDNLQYPEGLACASVLEAGQGMGSSNSASLVVKGTLIGGLFKILISFFVFPHSSKEIARFKDSKAYES